MTVHSFKRVFSIALITATMLSLVSIVLLTHVQSEILSTSDTSNQESEDEASISPIDLEIAKWQNLIKEHPTYRDGYIELAQLYEKKGDIAAAQLLIKTAHNIDPFSERVIEVGKVLGVKSF